MKRVALLLSFVSGVLVVAAPALAAPAPLRLTSISPLVAERGQLVTITGGGFGARNLQVTVGGDPVALVEATGNRASFRVPALGPVGKVIVLARNPGGHVGRIGLTVKFDGNTVAVADETAAVAAPIGSEGGTISVEGMSLAIPAGAVPAGQTITVTPLRSLRGSPFAAAPVGVKLEPSGLVLLKPATLTLPRPAGSASEIVGFGFNDDGEGLHLVPSLLSANAVQLKVWHFSGAGVLSARLAELEAVFGYEPTPAHELAEQRIAIAVNLAAATGADPTFMIFTALFDWAVSVRTGLEVAATGPLAFYELAFGEWQAWQAHLQEYRDPFTLAQRVFVNAVTRVQFELATEGAVSQARRLLPQCTGPTLPLVALRDVIRLANAVTIATLPIEQQAAGDGTSRALPDGINLPTACLDVEITGIEHAAVLARDRDNRFAAQAQVVFWQGPPSNTIPLRFRLVDTTTGSPVPLSSGSSSTGRAVTTVHPVTLGQRELALTVDLDASGTDAVLRTFFDQRSTTIPVRERLDLQARRATDPSFSDTIGPTATASTVTLRIRLAGDNINAIPITLNHDATGSLPASATTDPNGVAIVTYTAPPSPTIELVTATLTENGTTTGDAIVITTREPVLVSVTPSFGFIAPGKTLQFTATVTGTPNKNVNWSVSGGGSIDANGLFTASASAPGGATFDVFARSAFDSTSVGGAFVTIVAEDVSGTYRGQHCNINFGCNTISITYACGGRSQTGNGTVVCAWFNREFGNVVTDCAIETTGDQFGGPFTGTVVRCFFAQPTIPLSRFRVEGSIGQGKFTATLFARDFQVPGEVVLATYDLIKVGPA